MSDILLLGFAESRRVTGQLADLLAWPSDGIEVHRFPDGESRVRLPAELPQHVVICLSLDHPNEKLVELLLAADAARAGGAEKVSLVAPYLCYMRQDMAFHPGEAVSQKTIGSLLGDSFDAVVTVDPHLHRIERLDQAVTSTQAVSLTATRPIAEFVADHFERPLLIGPDEESLQWVSSIAEGWGFDFTVGRKERMGDRNVRICLPDDLSVTGRDVVIVDDMASTGRTMLAAVESVKSGNPASLSLIVTHALFVGDAEERIRAAGIDHLWSTDTIAHPTNAIGLAPLMADAIRNL
ncbi:ribose-phosphate pyrophosphokinase [Mariprofundus ferrinatatus]|uniref:Ribose-phosphate pyrophosphokinase n=1 Tax=Mariprofundus ferrinatatus TaxID=1921087 RepID=A0A2K8L2X4_9PROT|nr:ribose-phosphate diphosphokinase [Mariprofundus ferrinatatus]ATX81678.1 ribose-phosphate pyrophosphokinase [Mariprofundus ferrinatatus]